MVRHHGFPQQSLVDDDELAWLDLTILWGLDLRATFLLGDALSLETKAGASGLSGDEQVTAGLDEHTGPQSQGEQANDTDLGLVLPGPDL